MIEKLNGLKNNVEKQMDSIAVNTQSINVNDFMTLAFPLLQEKLNENNEIAYMQASFEMDFPSKILLPTKEDL